MVCLWIYMYIHIDIQCRGVLHQLQLAAPDELSIVSLLFGILPHPRSPGGKPQRLTARVKIASAPVFPTASFCRRGQFPICLSVRVSVRPWCQSDVPPKFGSSKSGARCSFERGNPNFSTAAEEASM